MSCNFNLYAKSKSELNATIDKDLLVMWLGTSSTRDLISKHIIKYTESSLTITDIDIDNILIKLNEDKLNINNSVKCFEDELKELRDLLPKALNESIYDRIKEDMDDCFEAMQSYKESLETIDYIINMFKLVKDIMQNNLENYSFYYIAC